MGLPAQLFLWLYSRLRFRKGLHIMLSFAQTPMQTILIKENQLFSCKYLSFWCQQKNMFLFLRISNFYTTQKIKMNFHFASFLLVLHLYEHLLGQTKLFWTFWFTNHNRGKQLLSLETQFICLFQNRIGANPSGMCGPFQKGNQLLLSLGQILMQTILAPNFVEIFSGRYFSFWC